MQVFSRFLFPIQRNGHWNSVPKAFPLSSCTHLEHICPNVADRGPSQANRCCESKRTTIREEAGGAEFQCPFLPMLLVPLQYFHHYPPKDLPVLPGSVPQSPALSSPPASALWSVPDPVPVFLPVLAPASLAELLFLLAPASLPASSPPVLPYRSSYSSPYQADCSRSPEFLPKYCQRSSLQHSAAG